MYKTRLQNLQKKLKSATCDAFYISHLTNILYLTGFTGTFAIMIVTPQKAHFFTDTRYLEHVRKSLPSIYEVHNIRELATEDMWKNFLKKNHIASLGIEAEHMSHSRYISLQKTIRPTKLIPTTHQIEKLRTIKDEEELKYLIKTQRIAEKVLSEITNNIQSGITEKEIAWEIERLGHEFGADTISFTPIIGFGAHSAMPHHQNTDKKFKPGEVVLIDMGMKYRGYCSDMTRTFFTGKPSLLEQKIYSIVLEAQEAAIRKMTTGTATHAVDAAARDIIKQAGYEEFFLHSLGHGIGLDVHESPTLSPRTSGRLAKNEVVTSEPGIYLAGKFGIRIEDMIIVDKKPKNITKFAKKLKDTRI